MMVEYMAEFARDDKGKVKIVNLELIGKSERVGCYFSSHIQHVGCGISFWPGPCTMGCQSGDSAVPTL